MAKVEVITWIDMDTSPSHTYHVVVTGKRVTCPDFVQQNPLNILLQADYKYLYDHVLRFMVSLTDINKVRLQTIARSIYGKSSATEQLIARLIKAKLLNGEEK